MKRNLLLTVALVAAFAMQTGAASAITIGFAPSAQTVGVGDSLTVDVVVSDLAGEVVSAYDLDVTYDASILTATSVTFGSDLGDESLFEVLNDSDLSVLGIVDFAQVSLLSDIDLQGLQSDSVVLATLGFQATATGTSALGFHFDAFNDVKGLDNGVLDLDARPGSVSAVPEPSAALVFGLGTLIFGARISRRRV